MPRSTKVFKKRQGRFFERQNQNEIPNLAAVQNDSLGPETECKRKKQNDSRKVCAKEKKIPNLEESFESFSCNNNMNAIMDLNILSHVFKFYIRCKTCENGLDLQVLENNNGLSINIKLLCSNCNFSYVFNTSEKHENSKIATVNSRFVYAMRCIGGGAEAGRMFCGVMNLSQPPSRFGEYNRKLYVATKSVCEEKMSEAVQEATVENSGNVNLAVAVDGTWQKRGYTSLNGVVTVTSIDTGKVLDVEVLSKYCLCKKKFQHSEDCKKNFEGVSGMMEVEGVRRIFQRSTALHNVRYTTYLGDGDSKAFEAVRKKKIYGDEHEIQKLECIGHVMKRMGTRLRQLKANMKGKVLADGKRLSGKKRLTDAEIDKIQTYYGLAIRRNLDSVKNMQQAIWAIFLHKISTDNKPQHGFCPAGEDSWCGFKKAESKGMIYQHKHSLPEAVVEAMRPIFRDLSRQDLLKKCLHGKTQNPNESVNNVIWSRIPKSTFVHIETLSLGVYDAICSFNSGNITKLEVLRKLGIEPGKCAVSAMKCLDKEKLLRAKYAFSETSNAKRKAKRLKRKAEHDNIKENQKKSGYGAGMF